MGVPKNVIQNLASDRALITSVQKYRVLLVAAAARSPEATEQGSRPKL
jgi:hypothetical protein